MNQEELEKTHDPKFWEEFITNAPKENVAKIVADYFKAGDELREQCLMYEEKLQTLGAFIQRYIYTCEN